MTDLNAVIFAGTFACVGWLIGYRTHRHWLGFILGLLAGVLGLVILGVLLYVKRPRVAA